MKILVTIVFSIILACLEPLIVEWLWNSLVPTVFGLKEVTYIQAFGLLLLCQALFGTGSFFSFDKDGK